MGYDDDDSLLSQRVVEMIRLIKHLEQCLEKSLNKYSLVLSTRPIKLYTYFKYSKISTKVLTQFK